jgi:chemotaxis protein methyltransferase CheR
MIASSTLSALGDGRPRLTPSDMRHISRLVYQTSGIALRPDTKQAMVLARLQKRLRLKGFTNFADYLRFVERDDSGEELTALIDAITTNHTSFFREPRHFDFLVEEVLPKVSATAVSRPVLGWCAACATGEEAYTLGVTILDHVPPAQHERVRLLASDLSTKALRTAQARVYALERVSHVQGDMLRRHFERGRGPSTGYVRVKQRVANLIEFRRLNLVEIETLGVSFDFIFCRNVMIYFDADVRRRVVAMLQRHLQPGGYLFVSHSESLNEVNHTLRWRMPGVYQRGDA